VPMTKKFSTK